MRYAFLSAAFYEEATRRMPQMLRKRMRPYAIVRSIAREGITYAIPFHTGIRGSGFICELDKAAGLDYRKALVIREENLDSESHPYLRTASHLAVWGKDNRIAHAMDRQVEKYRKHVIEGRDYPYLFFTTLQFFHKELGIHGSSFLTPESMERLHHIDEGAPTAGPVGVYMQAFKKARTGSVLDLSEQSYAFLLERDRHGIRSLIVAGFPEDVIVKSVLSASPLLGNEHTVRKRVHVELRNPETRFLRRKRRMESMAALER